MIRVAHSPDSDDYFMFWAIKNNRIDTESLEFSFEAYDTARLNVIAQQDDYDVIAISAATYPKVASEYLVLSHGASVGRGFGPVVVAKEKYSVVDLNHLRVGIPGKSTTAASLLERIAPSARTTEIPIAPFSLVYETLDRDEVDAALLIHEGQIEYKSRGLEVIVDTGKWWEENYNLPLPLGINVIRKDLGDNLQKVSNIISRSIEYGLANYQEVAQDLVDLNIQRGTGLQTADDIAEYLGRYANQDTSMMDEDCKRALSLLVDMDVEFV